MEHTWDNTQFWEPTINKIQSLLLSNQALSVGFSGGKDSTCVLVVFLEAIKRLVESGHTNLPTCYVLNANTRREMPLIASYAEYVLVQLQIYCASNKLPVEVHQVEPDLTGRFTWYCLARGKLPRYAGQSSDCAVMEKINPQQNLVKRLQQENGIEIVALVGTRLDESDSRRRSMMKYSMDEATIVKTDNGKTFAPIADWDIDQVWEFLTGCQSADKPARIFPTFLPDFHEMTELYRAANDGVCGVITGDDGNRANCGSRFGCSYCTMSGDRDKSLESMIETEPEKYGFLLPFVKFRKFLLSIRFDMNRRDFKGRKVSDAGYIKVTPDYFSPATKRELFRYLVTMDAEEIERARRHEKLWYENKIEHNEFNKLLCSPVFQNITQDDVLAIDFMWSIGRDFREASPAARDFLEIHDLGHRYHIPDVPVSERISIPKHRWFNISACLPYEQEVEGISGFLVHQNGVTEVDVTFADKMMLSPAAGFCYLQCVRDLYFDLHLMDPTEICRAALKNEWVYMRKADLKRYDDITKRNDYIYKLYATEKPRRENEDGDDVLMTVSDFLIENSISDEEHNQLLEAQKRSELEEEYEHDLFGVDSVIDVMFTQHPQKQSTLKKELTSIDSYQLAASQMSIPLN